MHNGAHLTIAPRVVDALRVTGARGAVVVGGIVPPADVPTLHEAGVAAVLGPGASDVEVVDAVTHAVPERSRGPLTRPRRFAEFVNASRLASGTRRTRAA